MVSILNNIVICGSVMILAFLVLLALPKSMLRCVLLEILGVILWIIFLVGSSTLMLIFDEKRPRWSSDPWKQRRIEVLIGFSPWFVFAVFMIGKFWWDLTHPQQWETPGSNPNVYGWPLAVFWFLCICGPICILRKEGRMDRNEKASLLLKRTERLIHEKKFAQAESGLEEAKRLSGYPSTKRSSKERKNGTVQ